MTGGFGTREVETIGMVARIVGLRDRGVLSTDELAQKVLDTLYSCEDECLIEQCIARLPAAAFPPMVAEVERVLAREHPAAWFCTLALEPAELEAADARVRRLLESVRGFLANPVEKIPVEIDPNVDLRRLWEEIRTYETVPGSSCKNVDCDSQRIKLGCFCPAHHMQMIYGRLPPMDE